MFMFMLQRVHCGWGMCVCVSVCLYVEKGLNPFPGKVNHIPSAFVSCVYVYGK